MSAERSPATDQAAELEELVSALGYEPDAGDGAVPPPPPPRNGDAGAPATSTVDGPDAADGPSVLPASPSLPMVDGSWWDRPENGSGAADEEHPEPSDASLGEGLVPEEDRDASTQAAEAPGLADDHVRDDAIPAQGTPPPDVEAPTRNEPAFVPYTQESLGAPVPTLAPPSPVVQEEAVAAVPAGASASRAPKVRRRRMIRSRKVRRVVRHIDPWSVLTFSVIFHLCLFGALLLAGSLVWSAAEASGTIENVESFIRDLGDYETWEIQGDAVLRAGVIIAGMLTLASSILVVLLTVVFNLISDLIGGIRVTVLEEEVHRVPVARRR